MADTATLKLKAKAKAKAERERGIEAPETPVAVLDEPAPGDPRGEGFMGGLFPATSISTQNTQGLTPEQIQAEKQKAIEMSPWGALAKPEAGAAPLVPMAEDAFSFLTRSAEGIKRLISGQGAEGYMEAMTDPHASIFQESRESDAEFWDKQADSQENPALKKMYQGFQIMNTMGYGALEDPGTYFMPLQGLFRRMKGQLPLAGAPTKSLTDPSGLPLTPAQAKGKDISIVESYAQANPFTQDIPLKIKERQMGKLKETTSNVAKKMGAKSVDDIAQGGSARGALIEQRVKEYENINQNLFKKGEDFIQREVGQRPINFSKVDVFGPSKAGLVDAAGKPIISVIEKVYKSQAMKRMEDYLERAGHTLGQPAKNIRDISKETIIKAEKFYGDIKEARSVSDLMKVKRNIADEVFDGVQKGFFTGEKNISFLRGINKQMNDAIEESIIHLSPGVEGEDLAGVFRSMNKQYEMNLDALMTPSKKLGLGRADLKHEDVIGKIKLLGVKNLKKIKEKAKKSLSVRPIYEELQRGAYEDLIGKSINRKTMQLSPDKLATAWNTMDSGLKKSLFPESVVAETDKLVSTLQKISAGDLARLNPSGTAKVNFLTKVFRNKVDAASALMGYPLVKHYYKSGKLPHESVWNLLRGSDGKMYITSNKLNKMAKAESIGNFLRSELNLTREEK